MARVGESAFSPALSAAGEYWAHVHLLEQEVPGGKASPDAGEPAALSAGEMFVPLGGGGGGGGGGDGLAGLEAEIVERARRFEGYGWIYVVATSHPALRRERLDLDPRDAARWNPDEVDTVAPHATLVMSVSDQVPGAVLPGCVPVIAIDMWEHAYVAEHGEGPDARAAHAKSTLANLDWDVVADRLSRGRPFRPLRNASQLRALLAHANHGGEFESGADL